MKYIKVYELIDDRFDRFDQLHDNNKKILNDPNFRYMVIDHNKGLTILHIPKNNKPFLKYNAVYLKVQHLYNLNQFFELKKVNTKIDFNIENSLNTYIGKFVKFHSNNLKDCLDYLENKKIEHLSKKFNI